MVTARQASVQVAAPCPASPTGAHHWKLNSVDGRWGRPTVGGTCLHCRRYRDDFRAFAADDIGEGTVGALADEVVDTFDLATAAAWFCTKFDPDRDVYRRLAW